jgi:hypothetical protein
MANVTFGMVAAIAGIGVPIHRAVGRDLVGWIALLIEIFAILGFDRGRVDRI